MNTKSKGALWLLVRLFRLYVPFELHIRLGGLAGHIYRVLRYLRNRTRIEKITNEGLVNNRVPNAILVAKLKM